MNKDADTVKKVFTCIVCPRGCEVTATLDKGGDILSIEGNFCPRGETYVRNELTHPMRQLTTTVKIDGGIYSRLPVILSGEIPKERMMDVMEAVSDVKVTSPIKRGDVIVADVCGLNVDVIASRSM
ncbi:MAG: DUF1667 domain-containing protein [Lachnospiraceae bacterium]|jgi:CxxC motif-containing protein|nr:DUF1667 domain-containing protein [Lachnospiraceae bacterium]